MKAGGYRLEKEMQSDFSHWVVTEEGMEWIVSMKTLLGLPASVSATFELKHVRCEKAKADPTRPISICTEAECRSRLRVTDHEDAQADGLAIASGNGALVGSRARSWCHKLPDVGAGYRPVDCVVLGTGTLAMFVMGWSCPVGGFRCHAVPWEALAQLRGMEGTGNGRRAGSVTEAWARSVGYPVPMGR